MINPSFSIVGNMKSNILFLIIYSVGYLALGQYCIPNASNGNRLYIDDFSLNTINNNNSNFANNTYQDWTSLSTDLVRGQTYTFSITATSNGETWRSDNAWYSIFIDYNDNDSFSDAGEMIYRSTSTDGPNFTFDYTLPFNANLGTHRMRVRVKDYWIGTNPCNDMNRSETEDYTINVIRPPFDTFVSSNSLIIEDGSTVPSGSNNTNFGSIDINAGATQKTFTITNGGLNPLNLTGAGVNKVQFTGSTDFTIISQPSLTTLTAGQSTTFIVEYDPSTIATHTGTISIPNSDPVKDPYNFVIEGEGKQTFPDTDGDGITDNIDQDDDNDGILDGDEQNLCVLVSTSRIVTTEFLRETFGQGTATVRINDNNPDVSTTYCFEDNTAAQAADECDATRNVDDGQYTIAPSAQITDWAFDFWHLGGDHTGDLNGRMAIFNADPNPGEFYSTEIDGIIANVPVTYSFWALNLDTDEAPCLDGCPGGVTWDDLPRLRPRVRVEFRDEFGTLIASESTGDIAPTDKDNLAGDWYEYSATFTPTVSKFTVTFINDQPGGLGNDLALDDILITQDLCDLDGDGVADVIDIDNDNDGIPNLIEIGKPAGLSTVDSDGDALTTGSADWVDSNSNGVHDLYETHIPIDSDGDGIPDYLDLDSDNDGIFDVLENDGFGDIDVNGDGIGEGNDADSTISNDNLDGDGLLDPVDTNDDDADEDDHGTSSYVWPVDTDGDGIADYLDIDSNDATNDLSNGSDIDNSLYADQDGNNDGRIDATVDIDRDGVYDGNNDFDTDIYGAPIDVIRDLYIDFDGRNDYIQSSNSLTSGASDITMMAWILMDPLSSGTMTVMGDGNMDVYVTPSGTVGVNFATSSVTGFVSTNTGVSPGHWYHITVVLDGATGFLKLYVNGNEELEATISPMVLGNSTEPFTLGRNPSVPYNQYFNGGIDEVKVFTKALSDIQLRRIMHQEIEPDGTYLTGKVLPRIITGLLWSDLSVYYSFNELKGDILDDESDSSTNGTMYNIKSILPQTAPLPYVTSQNGDLNSSATLMRNDVWDASHMETYPHSIIRILHEVNVPNSMSYTGMVLEPSGKVIVEDGSYLGNDWYLILNGNLELQGDAQLWQTINSELDDTSAGSLSRSQEGETDVFSYNYWSSPVGNINTTSNNNPFYLNMLEDDAGIVQFTGINTGTPPVTSPATLSGRWLYSFMNGTSYNDWARINPNSTAIPAGYGWSQKGTTSSSANWDGFVFRGKPNNGVINITATPDSGGASTTSLVGNPYPSAIDVREFIDDNIGLIDGTIYLWDQFRGTNHQLAYYEGGYATITKMATVKAAQFDGLGYLNGGAGPAIQPTFFLPVSQGFFVTVTGSGVLEFNNSQRVFKQESLGESIFLAAPGSNAPAQDKSSYQDLTIKLLRLDLEADTGASRQIAIGFDSAFTDGYDYGYDAYLGNDLNETDLYSPYQGEKYLIKALTDITPNKVVDIAVKGITTKAYKLKLSEIQNFDPSQEIWLRDNELGVYHDFRSGDYHFNFFQNGADENRFDIVFENQTLSNADILNENVNVFYNSDDNLLFINGLEGNLESLALYDLSGKELIRFRESELTNIQSGILTPQLSQGIYILFMYIDGQKLSVKLQSK